MSDDMSDRWWKDKSSQREWTLPNGKKIRQTTLEEWK